MTQPHQLLRLMCIIFCLGDIGNCDPLRAEGPSARAVLGPGVHDEDLSVAATAEVLREGVVAFAESAMTLMTSNPFKEIQTSEDNEEAQDAQRGDVIRRQFDAQ